MVLFVFETLESETAFLDVADGTERLDVITANAEALGKGASWARRGPFRRPARWTGRRWPHCTEFPKYNLLAPDISCKGASTAEIGRFCRNLRPSRPVTPAPLQSVAESKRQAVGAHQP